MARTVESSGSIETFCHSLNAPSSRRGSASFDEIAAGDRVALCFSADDGRPPYALKIRAPNGAVIVDRIVRALPTGEPQSEPPIELVVSAAGAYAVEIRELQGGQWGKATVRVG